MSAQSGFADAIATRLYFEVSAADKPLVLLRRFGLDCYRRDDQ